MGFDKNQVLVIHNSSFLGDKTDIFKETLLLQSDISHVSKSNTVPGSVRGNWGVKPEGQKNLALDYCFTDEDFLETMKLELVSGRYFSLNFESDESAILLNETAVRNINCLEHHGLNRCPDKGKKHFRQYAALGILAYNLHKLGNILLEKDRKALKKKWNKESQAA